MVSAGGMEVGLEAFCEAEMDEQWTYVRKKYEQRWLWYAIDHTTSTILAYVFGKRKDEVFMELKVLLWRRRTNTGRRAVIVSGCNTLFLLASVMRRW